MSTASARRVGRPTNATGDRSGRVGGIVTTEPASVPVVQPPVAAPVPSSELKVPVIDELGGLARGKRKRQANRRYGEEGDNAEAMLGGGVIDSIHDDAEASILLDLRRDSTSGKPKPRINAVAGDDEPTAKKTKRVAAASPSPSPSPSGSSKGDRRPFRSDGKTVVIPEVDEEIMRLVIDAKRALPPDTEKINIAQWTRIMKHVSEMFGMPFSGWKSLNARVTWLGRLFKDRHHEEYHKFSPEMKSMLQEYKDYRSTIGMVAPPPAKVAAAPKKIQTGEPAAQPAVAVKPPSTKKPSPRASPTSAKKAAASISVVGELSGTASRPMTVVDPQGDEQLMQVLLETSARLGTTPQGMDLWNEMFKKLPSFLSGWSIKHRVHWLVRVFIDPSHREHNKLTKNLRAMLATCDEFSLHLGDARDLYKNSKQIKPTLGAPGALAQTAKQLVTSPEQMTPPRPAATAPARATTRATATAAATATGGSITAALRRSSSDAHASKIEAELVELRVEMDAMRMQFTQKLEQERLVHREELRALQEVLISDRGELHGMVTLLKSERDAHHQETLAHQQQTAAIIDTINQERKDRREEFVAMMNLVTHTVLDQRPNNQQSYQ